MVKHIANENSLIKLGTHKELYQCEECGFYYADNEWAKKCEAWCREHKSCNLEITGHAVENLPRF